MRLVKQSDNAHELVLNGGIILFSYETPVACSLGNTCYARKKYVTSGSNTTKRHLKAFSNFDSDTILEEEAFIAKLNRITSMEIPHE
jgi:hypothetical protein